MKFVIVGSGRCGSTFVRDMVNLHSDCFVCGESYWHVPLIKKYGDIPITVDELIRDISQLHFASGVGIFASTLAELALSPDEFFSRLRDKAQSQSWPLKTLFEFIEGLLLQRTGKNLFGDKTPHYGYHVETLRRIWPDLKVIHMMRDGYECALSMRKRRGFQLLASVGVDDWTELAVVSHLLPVPSPPNDWQIYHAMWQRQVRRISDQLRSLPRDCWMELHYGDLLRNPRDFFGQAAGFIGLRADRTWLDACAGRVRRSSRSQNPNMWSSEKLPASSISP